MSGKQPGDNHPSAGRNELDEALAALRCPECGGEGRIPLGEHIITRDMAIDAGEPAMEGMSMGIEYTPCRCGSAEERIRDLFARVQRGKRNGARTMASDIYPAIRREVEALIEAAGRWGDEPRDEHKAATDAACAALCAKVEALMLALGQRHGRNVYETARHGCYVQYDSAGWIGKEIRALLNEEPQEEE